MRPVPCTTLGDGMICAANPGSAWRLPPGFPTLMVLALLGLTGCAMDREDAVRAQVGLWVVLGDTSYFSSQRECTAALFRTGAKQITSKITKVTNVGRGLRLIRQGQPVAFMVDGKTPAEVHKALDKVDRSTGLAILASGLAARDCFAPELKAAFSTALNSADTVLMFDPANNAFVLFVRPEKRLFYARGDV